MRVEIDFTGFHQKLLLDGKPFHPSIYEGEGEPPPGFNGVRLILDASESSLLDWKEQMKLARDFAQKGLFILWELQFSLPIFPPVDEVQFLTLSLSIQHFVDTIWPEFQHATFGVALFRGSYDPHQREELLNYLKGLAAILPEEVACFIFLDTSSLTTPDAYFDAICFAGYGHLKLIIKGNHMERYPYATPALAWESSSSPLGYCGEAYQSPLPEIQIPIALCLPEQLPHEFPFAIEKLATPFRVIPEALLDQMWDGIEQLYVFPHCLSEWGLRKIRGFIAAGGIVTSL
jgi:hypothetical protein